MANPEQLKILKQGVNGWNAWRSQNEEIRPDLRRADLSQANLCWADLSRANLREANLFGANLFGANLRNADLRGADLTAAHLTGADLALTNLRNIKGFTVEQLSSAVYDETTKLPQYLIKQSEGKKKK